MSRKPQLPKWIEKALVDFSDRDWTVDPTFFVWMRDDQKRMNSIGEVKSFFVIGDYVGAVWLTLHLETEPFRCLVNPSKFMSRLFVDNIFSRCMQGFRKSPCKTAGLLNAWLESTDEMKHVSCYFSNINASLSS
eukprot:gb/GEZN01023344.1/.p1 GENE.gb/GEZN01023344.1/~~gb/GEZN01023344.1/.p1  ORF type:complete len:156 (-),score=11.47 gb/GEZN01023344.1/:129-530(-)